MTESNRNGHSSPIQCRDDVDDIERRAWRSHGLKVSWKSSPDRKSLKENRGAKGLYVKSLLELSITWIQWIPNAYSAHVNQIFYEHTCADWLWKTALFILTIDHEISQILQRVRFLLPKYKIQNAVQFIKSYTIHLHSFAFCEDFVSIQNTFLYLNFHLSWHAVTGRSPTWHALHGALLGDAAAIAQRPLAHPHQNPPGTAAGTCRRHKKNVERTWKKSQLRRELQRYWNTVKTCFKMIWCLPSGRCALAWRRWLLAYGRHPGTAAQRALCLNPSLRPTDFEERFVGSTSSPSAQRRCFASFGFAFSWHFLTNCYFFQNVTCVFLMWFVTVSSLHLCSWCLFSIPFLACEPPFIYTIDLAWGHGTRTPGTQWIA